MPIIHVCDFPTKDGDCKKAASWRRQNCQYTNDLDNFEAYCEEHQVYVDQCWDEQWAEYYSSVLPAKVRVYKEPPDMHAEWASFLALFKF